MITVACVRTGTRYGPEYVYRLQAGVQRYLKRPFQFVCLTDRPNDLTVNTIDISADNLPGWWGKMALFRLAAVSANRVLYFDLDTVICGDLGPLADINTYFGICENFTRLAGCTTWPCRYGSCVMTFNAGYGWPIWKEFAANRQNYMDKAGQYGDQRAIEMLAPAATLLQSVLPPRYFLGYRDITETKPANCSIVVFAGRSKPHNCETKWITSEWIS